MNKPIKGYGALGLVFSSVFLIGVSLVIQPLEAQALVALFGLGVLLRGVRVFRESRADSE